MAQRGVCTLLEMLSAIASNGVLYSTMWEDVRPHGKFREGSVAMNWLLTRAEVEVRRGVGTPKPPQERGGACRSQIPDIAVFHAGPRSSRYDGL